MGCTHSSRDGVIKDLSQLDSSLLDFKGGNDTAEDGPDAGLAGEQEAVMAEQEKDEPATGARVFVRDLVEKIMSARAIDGAGALKILTDLATQLDPQAGQRKLTPGQFASAGLAEATDRYLAETGEADAPLGTGDEVDPTALMEAEMADDADDAEEPESDENLPDADESDEARGLGQDLAPWKQQLLARLIPARQVHGHDAQIREADELTVLLGDLAVDVYLHQGIDEDTIMNRLAQRRDGTIVTWEDVKIDPKAYREGWCFRTAFWMVSSPVDPVELLREFKLPVLKRPKPQRASVDHAQASSDDVVDDRPADSQDSDEVDQDDRDDDEPVAEDGGRFIVSSDGETTEVDRPTVDSRNLPKPAGDKSKSEQPPFNKGSVGKSGGDRGSVERGKTSSKPQSDETILANLPDDVIEAAIRAVLEDDDPVECWAYRSPETVRAEADRRILLEYGQHVAA